MPADFTRLGLTGNPFESIAPGTALSWVAWPPELREAIAQPRLQLQLVGLPGSGKTTLLRAAEADLQSRGVRVAFIDLRDRAQALDLDADVLLIDELSHRPASLVLRLARTVRRKDQSLIAGAHFSRALLLALGGLSVTTLRLNESPQLDWIASRLDSATIPGRTPPELSPFLPDLARRCGNINFRIQRVLYELFENLARGSALLDAAAIDRAFARAAKFFPQDAL